MGTQVKHKHSARAATCFILLIGMVLSFVSCKKTEEKVKEEAAYVVGLEEYVYGFPLVIMEARLDK